MFARRTGWNLAQNRYAAALNVARERGEKLLDLTVSNPTECGFNFDSEGILAALNHPESLRYNPQPRGLQSAREAVAEYYNSASFADCAPRETRLAPPPFAGTTPTSRGVSAENIFLTTSTSEAYSFLFRLLCDAGDEVLVPRPSYPLFEFLADIQDVELRQYDLFYDHGWHIDVDGLARSVTPKTQAVMVVNPNNPTGSFVHESEFSRLASICAERELALISDEVFLDYKIEALPEKSAAFNCECLSFALSGLSKISCLPQMKLAWIVLSGPAKVREEACSRLEIIADTYLSVNAPIQLGLPALLKQRTNIQPQLLTRIQKNLSSLDEQLRAAPSIERLKVEAGWYAVLRVPATNSDENLAIQLMEGAGVLVHPGHFYEFPNDGYLVVSLITPAEEFDEGIKRLLHVCQGPSE